MEVSEQLTRFEPEDLMFWTVSNLQRPFREDFSLQKSGIIAEKESQILGCRFVGFDEPKKRRPFSFPDIKKGVSVASPAGAACCTGRSVPPPVRRLRCKA